ncbi:MAG: sn-glycerol-1-phosphate dehydrogenase [Sphaerochaetaceae bacterium]|nr:sn-glycerol-1-phosphate dehydrogenase [Sphaerochaetaceae bacterium]MDD4842566.1 sn-glycerol-1-phosphate dehydrogenase [Sphaerochaetaceae bacterium]
MAKYALEGCSCGTPHECAIEHILIEKGALKKIPGLLQEAKAGKPFLVMDPNTYEAAGKRLMDILRTAHIDFSSYTYPSGDVQPDELALGRVALHFDPSCDFIIAIGTGVINDISKMLARNSSRRFMIVATAPSMDGFASPTSSMDAEGLKVSLESALAWAIIGDLDILAAAPMHMLLAGFGDMLAKYVSVCEWRISHLITGEYYCEQVAQVTRSALAACVASAPLLKNRDEQAVANVMQGLVTSGIAMAYAGTSRPASGMEHYISHLIDMRHLEFHSNHDLHGTQVAVGTLISLKLYENLKHLYIDRQKAIDKVSSFDVEAHLEKLHEFVGRSAESMANLEKQDKKYDVDKHAKRLDHIIRNWERILTIINDELPSYQSIYSLMQDLGMPTTLEEVGMANDLEQQALAFTMDIRDKYIASRLLWDIGELEY